MRKDPSFAAWERIVSDLSQRESALQFNHPILDWILWCKLHNSSTYDVPCLVLSSTIRLTKRACFTSAWGYAGGHSEGADKMQKRENNDTKKGRGLNSMWIWEWRQRVYRTETLDDSSWEGDQR